MVHLWYINELTHNCCVYSDMLVSTLQHGLSPSSFGYEISSRMSLQGQEWSASETRRDVSQAKQDTLASLCHREKGQEAAWGVLES